MLSASAWTSIGDSDIPFSSNSGEQLRILTDIAEGSSSSALDDVLSRFDKAVVVLSDCWMDGSITITSAMGGSRSIWLQSTEEGWIKFIWKVERV